ncbi:hypothetical protein SNE40_010263 [Patella caerulea]|uniref:PiggyBac transposable element-derived protein domain-containing protein n=1 Tax=Patella caerulea TaxID=87958 RepID=A0AAN8PZQ7_PATCE
MSKRKFSTNDVLESILNDSDSDFIGDSSESDSDVDFDCSVSERDNDDRNEQEIIFDDSSHVNNGIIGAGGDNFGSEATISDDVNSFYDQENYSWKKLDHAVWTPSPVPGYSNHGPRLSFDFTGYQPIDFFYRFFPEHLFNDIAFETNRYADQYFDSTVDLPPFSIFQRWKSVDMDDIKHFFALRIAMGFVRKPNWRDYWSTDFVTCVPFFSSIMSRNRYTLINSFLHYNNNENQLEKENINYDILFKVRPIINSVLSTYLDSYISSRDVSIDESLCPFKGKLSYKQYIPNKPHKWGVKFWVMCDAKTGFCLYWDAYTGKNKFLYPEFSVTENIVLQLVDKLPEIGHHIYMDNFYSSVKLFERLKSLGFGACGTLRTNRKGIPEDDEFKQKMKKGDAPKFFHKGDDILAVTWQDTKRVTALSTVHDNSVTPKSVRSKGEGFRVINKPMMISEYNKYMSGVDKLDQYMTYYRYPHKRRKGYQVISGFIMEIALVNAHIAYKLAYPEKNLTTKQFRIKIVEKLIGDRGNSSSSIYNHPDKNEKRLTERHFPAQYTNKKYKPDCIVCSDRATNNRKQTRWYCKTCNQAMCPEICFERYHVLANYKVKY